MEKRGRKSKHSQANIITVILLILLILVAIIIIWQIVKHFVLDSSSGVNIARVTIGLSIDKPKSFLGDESKIVIRRNTGTGNLAGIKFVFTNGDDSYVHTDYSSMQELETKEYNIDLKDKLTDVKRVEIYAIVKSGDKEFIGAMQDSMGELEGGGGTGPSSGYVCGDGVCGATETCEADNSACYSPPVCKQNYVSSGKGLCADGCQYDNIPDGPDTGRCDDSTLSLGCTTLPCKCDGQGGCIHYNVNPPMDSFYYWSFDNDNSPCIPAVGTGSCIGKEASGINNFSTSYGTVNWISGCKKNGCRSTSNTGQNQLITYLPMSASDISFTLSVWIYPESASFPTSPPYEDIMGSVGGYTYLPSLKIINSGGQGIINTTMNNIDLSSSSKISFNTWTFVTIKYENTNLYLYVNGTLQGIKPVGSRQGTAQLYRIFMHTGTTSNNFYGKIDELRYYDRALSDLEIAALYNY